MPISLQRPCATDVQLEHPEQGCARAFLLPLLHAAGPVRILRAGVQFSQDSRIKLHIPLQLQMTEASSCCIGFNLSQLVVYALYHTVIQAMQAHRRVHARCRFAKT